MPRKVLLIDDDRLQFRLTQAHFDNFQTDRYDLEWAETYEDGLSKLMSGAYAACLLDYQLGERDGLQLIREAVARQCRTPIVFLTAEAADRVDIAAMNAGALDYLVKGEITPRMIERSLRYAGKLAETLEALRLLATHDALTGVLNRREFDRILAEEADRALRFGHTLSLVIVDVDHFKRINDTQGHPVGDVVLREVARRIAQQVRTVDRVARMGGEEFGLVLVQADQASALDVARRVCAALRTAAVTVNETLQLPVSVSAGVATMPGDAGTASTLVAAADKALYAAKTAGRDRAVAAGT
ncbi:GGDEF domain-containing protein [Horticoccus sp. 23ND18S-11]|uniref:GGDEF domain-containing protein n=1 Tax=Horticoccus sp. 23ND18S-11 TaxID=3391832 RepID=UPI0039C90FB3